MKRSGDLLAMPGSTIDPTATVKGGSCIGRNSTVGAGVTIERSIIESDATIESGAVITDSFVAAGAHVDKWAVIASSFVTNGEILPIPR